MGENMENTRKIEKAVAEGLFLSTQNILITAGGFEDRVCGALCKSELLNIQYKKIVILDYDNDELNEPSKSIITDKANEICRNVTSHKLSNLDRLTWVLGYQENDRVLVDITGMTHALTFQVMAVLDKHNIRFDIVYTEAEIYYPEKSFYDELMMDTEKYEVGFSRYLEKERNEFVYSSNCDIVQPPEFFGSPEPGLPTFLIAFFTFRRSRLQILLQEFEVEKKIFILSEPVRVDLKWRKEFMKVANYDIIEKNEKSIFTLGTLHPFLIYQMLEENLYKSRDYIRYNLLLSPIGSKMQTIGSYLFWRKHPEISVVFTQPTFYIKDAYTRGYKDTFVITKESIFDRDNYL